MDEGVRRAIFDILRSSGQSEESLRQKDIAKAPERVIEHSERELESKLDSLVLPTMTFMVFGSIAIVAVIGLSPIFGMIGLNYIDMKFFILACGGILASFLSFTIFIGKQRPVTIPPPKIPQSDSRLPPRGKGKVLGYEINLWIPTVTVLALISLPGCLYLIGIGNNLPIISGPNTLWIVWGTSAAVATYAYLKTGPRPQIKDQVRKATQDWAIALNTIGSRILDGHPMQNSMAETSKVMPKTQVGKHLKEISSMGNKFSFSLDQAITKTGILKRIYNPLVVSLLEITTKIKRGSEKAAGRASMQAGNFLDMLDGIEQRFSRKISDATSNLWLMAIVLLPVVCALSVWIMDFMSEISLTMGTKAQSAGLANIPILNGSMETAEISLLKMIMGLTVIGLILIIALHVSTIKTGRDRTDFWNRVPLTVLSGVALYTLAYLGFSILSIAGS